MGKKYIGIGAAAHSYNGSNRLWSVSSLPLYLKGIATETPAVEIEELDENTQYNDFIITRLRTMWGIQLQKIKELFGEEKWNYLKQQAEPYLQQDLLNLQNETLKLSKKGIFISDGIMSDLLWI